MQTQRLSADGRFLYLVILISLVIMPGKSYSKERNTFFDSTIELKKQGLKDPPRHFFFSQKLKSEIPQKSPGKGMASPKNSPQKPDLVVSNTIGLSLNDVIANTLKNNVSIAVQEYQSRIRKEEIITQEAEFDPSFSLEAKANKQKQLSSSAFANPVTDSNTQNLDVGLNQKLKSGTQYELNFKNQRNETDFRFAGLNPYYTTRLELNVTQPLLKNFGLDVNKSNIYIAKNNLDISDFEFKSKVIDIVSQTENVYWDLVFSREDLKVQQKSVSRAKDLERRVKAQVEVGTLAPLEILQAKSEVASREEGVIQSQKLIQDNQDNLKNILNIPFDSPDGRKEILPLDAPQFIVTEPPRLEESIKTALANRPDYLAKKKELENQKIQVKFNQNQLYPSLDLVASFGLNGIAGEVQPTGFGTDNPLGGNYGRSLDRTFSGNFSTWEGGLLFKYPLGNRAAKSRLTASKLQAAQLLLDIKDLEKTIILEVREAARQIHTNIKRVQAARLARQLAEEKLSAEEKKFEVGLSTSFNVLEFQTDLAEEQSKELKAIIDFNKSQIQFRKVLAISLDTYNIRMTSASGS